MSGNVLFVGAGPGAPDLITLRGAAALDAAELVIYAGSLVNEKLLERAAGAELVNSAKLSLPEVIAKIEAGYRAGKRVVRLHTGDPSIYGAVSEQFRELDRLGIPYEVVPGVTSAFAAAAGLRVELTMPELSQSVIFTRMAGRTPVPEKEAIEALAAHGCTLCIYLSAGEIDRLVGQLRSAGLPPETPAAVVYRASWPNEKIVRGTLADIAAKVAEAGIKRQSIIVVGKVLDRDGALSKLYDETFATGYRASVGDDAAFHGRVALFALTRASVHKAAEIAAGLDGGAELFAPERYVGEVFSGRLRPFAPGGLADAVASAWSEFDGLVMVMAAGVVVRHIAPLCRNKASDPAVVVSDEAGNYAVSLLSGHLGGANRLAAAVARVTGGVPVITTATDSRKLMAFDELAARHGYRIAAPEMLIRLAAAMLDGEVLELAMPGALFERYYAGNPQFVFSGDTPEITVRFSGGEFRLLPRRYALGIGCRRDVPAERIESAVSAVLESHGIDWNRIASAASAELKRDEPGLLAFAAKRGLSLRFFTAEELNQVETPNPSRAAEEHVGIRSVSEAAALLAAGPGAKLAVEKIADGAVTVAVAEEASHEA